MSDQNNNSKSRRSVLKIAGISLTGLIGSAGLGAARSERRSRRGSTEQSQTARNDNYQEGTATAFDGGNANVNQSSDQNIDQRQEADGSGNRNVDQRQQAENVNTQFGDAYAEGEGSSASVNQESDQSIEQDQSA